MLLDILLLTPADFRGDYHLIRRQYVAQFMGDYQYQSTTIKLQCAGEQFSATGYTPVHPGWKQALKMTGLAEGEELDEELPLLNKGKSVDNCETKLESHQTKPPARFTEGSLIEAMKTVGKFVEDDALKKVLKDSKGIGTEATRANIIEVLFKRDYLSRKDKQVVSTEKGRALLEIAPVKLKDPILTAQWEEKLEQIAQGKFTFDAFINFQCEALYSMLDELKASKERHQRSVLQLQSETQTGKVYLCPLCQEPLRCLKNKKGRYFYGCSGYDSGCRFTTWEKQSRPLI